MLILDVHAVVFSCLSVSESSSRAVANSGSTCFSTAEPGRLGHWNRQVSQHCSNLLCLLYSQLQVCVPCWETEKRSVHLFVFCLHLCVLSKILPQPYSSFVFLGGYCIAPPILITYDILVVKSQALEASFCKEMGAVAVKKGPLTNNVYGKLLS
jgi:hypothetical protein